MGADRSHVFSFWKKWILRVHFFAWTSKLDLNRPAYKNKETRSNLEMLPPGLGSSWPEKMPQISIWLAGCIFPDWPGSWPGSFQNKSNWFCFGTVCFLWGRWIWQIPVLILLPPSWWTLPYIIYYNASHFPWHWGLVRTLAGILELRGPTLSTPNYGVWSTCCRQASMCFKHHSETIKHMACASQNPAVWTPPAPAGSTRRQKYLILFGETLCLPWS